MRFRMIVFICFIVAMMAVFALRLYKLQTAELVTADADSMTYRTTMENIQVETNGNTVTLTVFGQTDEYQIESES